MPRSLPAAVPVSDVEDIVTDIFDIAFTQNYNSNSTLPARIGDTAIALAGSPAPLLILRAVADITEIIANVTTITANLAKLGEIIVADECCDRIAELLTAQVPGGGEVGIAQLLYKGLIVHSVVDGQPVVEGAGEIHHRLTEGLYWRMDNGTLIPLGESLGRLIYTGVLHANGA